MQRLTLVLILLAWIALMNAESIVINPGFTGITLLDGSLGDTILEYSCGSFDSNEVYIDGNNWRQLYLEGESIWQEAGYPALPRLNRAIIIPERSALKIMVLESEYIEYDFRVAPSKGLLSREIDPDTVPYEFSEIYEKDQFWPGSLAELGTPYIFRDYRGISIKINPFQYNGYTGKLRVYTHLLLQVQSDGISSANIKSEVSTTINKEFAQLYKRHFLNYENDRYTTIEEQAGRMLIISYGPFMDAMQPFIDWKNQKGIATEIIDVSAIGNNSVNIQNYITAEYNAGDGLVWVLLVGDAAQVATKTYSSAGGDPQYTYLSGADYYSEIFIGRFSAETVAQVNTQVDRSIHYERDVIDGNWMQRGVGIASSQGSGIGHYGEADYVHMNYIRNDLLDYGYIQVDQIYDNNGGNAGMVANALNEGRGIINYCGHGSNTSWSSTGFNNTHVNALTNDYMLPFINSVACVNGNFTNTTCFAEAWMRATNGTAPTGAIAIFASSINQSWAPPMYGQDEAIDLLCDDQLNTIGGLWFNSVSYMIEQSGDTAMGRTWHIFGDPSLQVRTMSPLAMNIVSEPTIIFAQETYIVETGIEGSLASLSYEGEIISSAYSDADGYAYLFLGALPEEPVTLTLTVTGYNRITEISEVQLVTAGGIYLQMLGYELNSGENDILFAGDNAQIDITIINIGDAAAEDVELEFSTANEYITITDGSHLIPLIDTDEILQIPQCFSFSVSQDALNGIPITFIITMTVGEQVWNYSIGDIIEAEAGIISEDEEILMVLDLEMTDSLPLQIKNNNYQGEITYTIFITDTTEQRSLLGSTMSCSAIDFVPGESVDWIFTCENNSPDWEWIKDIVIDFPAGVEVEGATDFVGGSDELEFLGDTGNGVSCNWHGETSTGWGVLQNGQTASSTVSIAVQSGFIGDIELSWQLTGDDYGSAPHQITGTIDITSSGEPLSWLAADQNSGSLLPGEEVIHNLNFNTHELEAGIYTAEIIISSENGDTVIPVILYAGLGYVLYGDVDDNGVVESFDSSLVLQYSVGLDPLGAPLPWEMWRITRGDVDGNGVIEAFDSALILQNVVGLIDEFPVETGRDYYPPLGAVDIRVNNENGTWLEFYSRGDVYSLEVMSRSRDFILHEPIIADGLFSAYNSGSEIYRYALAGAEPFNRSDFCLKIPVSGYTREGWLEISLKINSYLTDERIYLDSDEGVLPHLSSLLGNYPNPFNPETTIEFCLAEEGTIALDIYNIRGQHIKNLISDHREPGYHQVIWDGRDAYGSDCATGSYIYLLRTSRTSQSRKMVLIK